MMKGRKTEKRKGVWIESTRIQFRFIYGQILITRERCYNKSLSSPVSVTGK